MATEDEMVRQHHQLDGYEFEQTLGITVCVFIYNKMLASRKVLSRSDVIPSLALIRTCLLLSPHTQLP